MQVKLQEQHHPPVHGVKKHLDPNVKPEHDKPVSNHNKQKCPTQTDTKPKALLRTKVPASQIVRKKLIDRSIKLLNRPKPQINLQKGIAAQPNRKPLNQPAQAPRETDNREENVLPQLPNNRPQDVRPPPVRHFEPNP